MAPGFGAKKGEYMKNKRKNDDVFEGTFGKMKKVKDFLPAPKDLVFKEKKTKVTLTLSQKSVDFFKKTAKKHKVAYQTMIRNLLDHYVSHQ